jgi:AcrR family transcriptional regulator
MAGVSMRRLGRELGVQPMSLYHHVPSRAALMVLMADRSVSELPEPNPELPWNERLVDLLMHTYRLGVDDPAVFPVLAAESLGTYPLPGLAPDSTGASSGLVRSVMALLDEGGIAAEERASACRGLIGLVVGFMAGIVNEVSFAPAGVSTGAERSSLRAGSEGFEEAQPGHPLGLRDPPVDGLRFSLQLFARGLAQTR